MPLGLKEQELRNIASAVGLSPPGVQRIIGNTAVVSTNSSVQGRLSIGLRLTDKDVLLVQSAQFEALLIAALKEYNRACPRVVQWLNRGDYNPNTIPVDITHATLLFACRTAGRLRAQVLRGS